MYYSHLYLHICIRYNNEKDVDSNFHSYTTLHNESYVLVAAKLGMDNPQDLARVEENATRYGEKRNTAFRKNTVIRIPSQFCSKWKLEKLLNHKWEDSETLGICEICHKKEDDDDDDDNSNSNSNPMLMCDGCDVTCHLSCAGLERIPDEDYLCQRCETILTARKNFYDNTKNKKSLEALLPPLPDCPTLQVQQTVVEANRQLHSYLSQRNETSFRQLRDNQEALATSLHARIAELQSRTIPQRERDVERLREDYPVEGNRIKDRHNIHGWSNTRLQQGIPVWIISKDPHTGRIRTYHHPMSSRHTQHEQRGPLIVEWNRLLPNFRRFAPEWNAHSNRKKQAEGDLKKAREDLVVCRNEEKARCRADKQELKQYTLFHSALWNATMLGVCTVRDDHDGQVLNMLREPDEMILTVPMTKTKSKTTTKHGTMMTDDRTSNNSAAVFDIIPKLIVGEEYAIFGCTELFNPERDDVLPMDLSGQSSMRAAQKNLMGMLEYFNRSILITSPSVPSSVHLRGGGGGGGVEENNAQQMTKCFDLSELVRDCNYPLHMPQAPTPQCLADNGLVLREYQQASLQWMIDKEENGTGMGFAGELWSRMQLLDGSDDYFYCDLTGSIVNNIFDFKTDTKQTDVSRNFGSLPTAGILGEEM